MRTPTQQQRNACAQALGWRAPPGTPLITLDEHYRTSIEQVASHLTVRECVKFALEIAGQCLPHWQSHQPQNSIPHDTIFSVEQWIESPTAMDDFQSLANRCSDAMTALDYPEFTDEKDPARARAMQAAEAAGCVASIVASYLASEPQSDISESVGWCARSGIKCATNRDAERQRQTERLVELLTYATPRSTEQ